MDASSVSNIDGGEAGNLDPETVAQVEPELHSRLPTVDSNTPASAGCAQGRSEGDVVTSMRLLVRPAARSRPQGWSLADHAAV